MSYLILGGAGFVGTELVKQAAGAGIDVSIGDVSSVSGGDAEFHVDVTDLESFPNDVEFEGIVNLAAVHTDDVRPIERYDQVNIGGARNVCEFARHRNINTIVFTSSVAVYGFTNRPTAEDGAINYFNDYGRTKYEAEKVYLEWYQEMPKDRRLVIVRPTVVFGKGNRGNVYNLFSQIANRKFVMIGSGENIKSLAYVENVAAFLIYSLSFKTGFHLYNYVDGPDFSVRELVSKAREKLFSRHGVGLTVPVGVGLVIGMMFDALGYVLGRSFPVSYIRVKKFTQASHFKSSVHESGFTAPVDISEALDRTLEHEFTGGVR